MNPVVLVAGAGPVGLTMAAELARFGVPLRVIDRAAARTDQSRALVVWSRTLEQLARLGCADRFVDAGMKVRWANVFARGERIAHVELDELPTPYPFALMLPQSETERLLEEHLAIRGVRVERRVELAAFSQAGDAVRATLRHADGREESIEPQWLVGCDGAHSTVRHTLGLEFEGNTRPSDWILADVELNGFRAGPDELHIFWHADGVLAVIPITPGRFRVVADVGEATSGTRPADPTMEQVQAVLDRRGPGGVRARDPRWLSSFRINERTIAEYRVGRVFLAGDAAHIHSPAGGQGMNTGMQDAFNLAWKLALVWRGLASPEPLLESYSIERSDVGRRVVADAGRLTTVAIMRGAVAQAIRNHVASMAFGLAPVREAMASKLSELSVGYPRSPLTDPHRKGAHGPGPGERAPVLDAGAPVGAGDTPRFALFAAPGPQAAAFIERHRDVMEPRPRPPFAEGSAWLVRPDGYIAAVARPDEWDRLDGVMGRILGA